MNADYIVTNSFHGTVFSILFEKMFYTVKIGGVNSRIENLLNIAELSERNIEDVNQIDLGNQIDFSKALKNIDNERQKSEAFLKNVLR